MRIEVVSRETDELDATSSEIGGTTSDLSELSRADLEGSGSGSGSGSEMSEDSAEGHKKAYGRKVCRVGEENRPGVADPLVELDGTLCGLGLEIGGNRTKAERRHLVFVLRVDEDEDEFKWVPSRPTRVATIK